MTHHAIAAIVGGFALYTALLAWVWCRMAATIGRFEKRERALLLDCGIEIKARDGAWARGDRFEAHWVKALHERDEARARGDNAILDAARARKERDAASGALDRLQAAHDALCVSYAVLIADPLIQRREAMRAGKLKRDAAGKVLAEERAA